MKTLQLKNVRYLIVDWFKRTASVHATFLQLSRVLVEE